MYRYILGECLIDFFLLHRMRDMVDIVLGINDIAPIPVRGGGLECRSIGSGSYHAQFIPVL